MAQLYLVEIRYNQPHKLVGCRTASAMSHPIATPAIHLVSLRNSLALCTALWLRSLQPRPLRWQMSCRVPACDSSAVDLAAICLGTTCSTLHAGDICVLLHALAATMQWSTHLHKTMSPALGTVPACPARRTKGGSERIQQRVTEMSLSWGLWTWHACMELPDKMCFVLWS